jgi:hypothetical protein
VSELPEPVSRYLDRSLASKQPLPRLVRLTQTGEMQLKPGRWLSFEAQQVARVDRVEFVWRARFALAPLVGIRVRDWFRDGDGGLEARLLGLIPVASAGGPETARSEAMRYLAELPWFPQAVLGNEELAWREVEHGAVEVATRVGSAEAAVTLHFDEAGDIVGAFAPDRPHQEGSRFVDHPWSGAFSGYEELGGVRVPTRAEVSWDLPDGRFTYFRGRVTRLEAE